MGGDGGGSSSSSSSVLGLKEMSAGKVAKLAAWAVVAEKLFVPSYLRASELLALNGESVVNSDLVLLAIAAATCPLGGLRCLFQAKDLGAKLAALVATALVGLNNVAARQRNKKTVAHQSRRLESAKGTEGEEEYVWRSSLCPGGELMANVYPDVITLYHNFFVRARTMFPKEPCLGTRVPGGGYEWESYERTAERAEAFGTGLLALGLKPGEKLGVYSVNSTQWAIAELGGYAYGLVNVALYSTLGADAVRYVIKHSEMVAVVCSVEVLNSVLEVLPECPNIKSIIVMDGADRLPKPEQKAVADASGVRMLLFSEVESRGRESPVDHIPPKPSDLATIMYTSGTTGDPKGVMLTHANVLANSTTYPVIVERMGVRLSPGDRYISYLPLTHIFERSALVTMFGQGVAVGFFSGKAETLVDDIAALRPTVLFGVPRIFNRVHDKVKQTVESSGSKAKKFLFKVALAEARKVRLAGGLPGSSTLPLWDILVFGKIKARLGGCCRIILSGGAPLGSETQDFLASAFGCPTIQGYGLTETSASGTFGRLEDPNSGHVGPPTPCLDLKLAPVPEMDYLPTDQPRPRGEICFRGFPIMQGYFKADDMTKEVIDSDGWFHTGDIGQINDNGTVTIIDRKKNIFKLAQGEYVAAEKLELQYGAAAPLVSQIFVYGDSFQSVLVAVVVPDPDVLRDWAVKNGLIGPDDKSIGLVDLCALQGVEAAVMAELKAAAKSTGMKGFEVVKAVHISPEAFAVENDLMTPTFKLRRPQLKARFKPQIDGMYERLVQGAPPA